MVQGKRGCEQKQQREEGVDGHHSHSSPVDPAQGYPIHCVSSYYQKLIFLAKSIPLAPNPRTSQNLQKIPSMNCSHVTWLSDRQMLPGRSRMPCTATSLERKEKQVQAPSAGSPCWQFGDRAKPNSTGRWWGSSNKCRLETPEAEQGGRQAGSRTPRTLTSLPADPIYSCSPVSYSYPIVPTLQPKCARGC